MRTVSKHYGKLRRGAKFAHLQLGRMIYSIRTVKKYPKIYPTRLHEITSTNVSRKRKLNEASAVTVNDMEIHN